MSVPSRIVTLFSFLLLIVVVQLNGQSKKELEQKKARLQKEIDATNKELKVVQKNKNTTAEQLGALRKKIRLREALISTINGEINSLGGEIASTAREITTLEGELQRLRREYAGLIRYAYKNRNVNRQMVFVFAASDFNQAYKRVKYLHRYAEYRREQSLRIMAAQQQLTGKKEELEHRKNEKTTLRNSEQKEKQTLEKERQQQDKLMKSLSDREKRLRKELSDKQAAKAKLDRAIESIVKKEIEAARKKATAAGKKNVTSSNVFSLTPEAAKLSSSFSGNKGQLPWPVEKGVITGTFGEHPHKELKGIVVKNNGIDIQSARGAAARVVFEGTVSGVVNIPGAGKAVIVRHGEYLSVYSNLESVQVKTGDKLSTKERIGTIAVGSDDKGELHLEIWRNTAKLDPQAWLARR